VLKQLLLTVAGVLIAYCGQAADPQKVTLDEVRQALAAMPADHPRLFAANGGLAKLRQNAATPLGQAMAARIIADADGLLDAAPLPWSPAKSTGQILMTSRAALYRINTLGMAYLLTGDEKYARRGIGEMTALAAFPDWNPAHFLDVAEMTMAFAVGYDWFYPALSQEQRQHFAQVLLTKGLRPSYGEAAHKRWVSGDNNWTQVCHAGMVAGALAVYEADPELAADVIRRAVIHLPKVMDASYGRNGSYPEGPTYWGYGTEFNAALIAMLDNSLNNSFGLADHPGFARTGEYITAMQTPTGKLYTYADSNSDEYLLTFAKFWWCAKFHRPDCFSPADRTRLADFSKERNLTPAKAGERMLPLALFCLTGELTQTDDALPLAYFSGNDDATPVAMHRSGPGPDAAYLAVKGGRPNVNHGHMDGGSFIFEAGGVRWFDDLGAEGYGHFQQAKVDLWSGAQGSDRWRIFRYSPRSHNIFMIDGAEQKFNGNVIFTSHQGEQTGQTSTLDLTPAYPAPGKVTRTVRLLSGREGAVTDQLTGVKPGSIVVWQLCTRAIPEIAVTGKTVTLRKNGKTLSVTGTAPGDWSWQMLSADDLAVPLNTPDWRATGKYLLGKNLDDVRILQLTLTTPADGKLDVNVTFTLQE